MRFFIQKIAVLAGVALLVGVAQADDSTYAEALEASRLQFAQKNYVEAQKIMEQALPLAKTSQDKVDATLRIGETLKQRKLYQQARERWQTILQMPDVSAREKVPVHALIAGSYADENDWANSRAEFQKIVENPAVTAQDKAQYRLFIAVTYGNQKNEAGARKELSAVVGDEAVEAPLRASAALQLGQSFLNTKDYAQARDAFERALEIANDPGTRVFARVGIADSYKAQGDANQLQQAYNQVIIESVRGAKILSDNKQYAAARALQEQALTLGTLTPTMDMTLRVQIGQNLLHEGKAAEGRAALEAFLAKQYGEATTPKERADFHLLRQAAKLNIAKSYALQGNKEQAEKLLNALLQEKPLAPGIENGVGEVRQLMP